MRNAKTKDQTDLHLQAIEALNDALGPAKAARFLGSIQRNRTDYVKISRKLHEGKSLDQILDAAKRAWRRSPRSRVKQRA